MGLSPGATALLAHLALYADKQGASWHSYASLGLRMGRSKGAVTAYMRELCESGIVFAESLRCQNGSNWRVRARLAGWSSSKDKTSAGACDIARSAIAPFSDATHPVSRQPGGEVKAASLAAGRISGTPKAGRQPAPAAATATQAAGLVTSSGAQPSGRSPIAAAEHHATAINALGVQPTERRAAKDTPDGVQPADPYNKTNDSKTNPQTNADAHANRSTASVTLDAIDAVWKRYPDFDWRKVFGGDAAFINDKVLIEADAEAGARLDETQRLLDQITRPDPAASRYALDLAITDLGLIATPSALDQIMASLLRLADDASIKTALDLFRKSWPRHWRKLDDARLIADACEKVLAADPAAKEIVAWRRRTASWRTVIERRAMTRQRNAAAIATINARITATTSACSETSAQDARATQNDRSTGADNRSGSTEDTSPTRRKNRQSPQKTRIQEPCVHDMISKDMISKDMTGQDMTGQDMTGQDMSNENTINQDADGHAKAPESMADKEASGAASAAWRRTPKSLAAAGQPIIWNAPETMAQWATPPLRRPRSDNHPHDPRFIVWPTSRIFGAVFGAVSVCADAAPVLRNKTAAGTAAAAGTVTLKVERRIPARQEESWITSMYNNGASAPGGPV